MRPALVCIRENPSASFQVIKAPLKALAQSTPVRSTINFRMLIPRNCGMFRTEYATKRTPSKRTKPDNKVPAQI